MKHNGYHTATEQKVAQEPTLAMKRIQAFDPCDVRRKDYKAVLGWIEYLEDEIERLKERNRTLEQNLQRFSPGTNRILDNMEE